MWVVGPVLGNDFRVFSLPTAALALGSLSGERLASSAQACYVEGLQEPKIPRAARRSLVLGPK